MSFKLPDNPILRLHIGTDSGPMQRFSRRAWQLSLIVFVNVAAWFRSHDGVWDTVSVLTICVLTGIALSIWLSVATTQFTLREIRDESHDLLRLTPLSSSKIVWGYVGTVVYRQRWILVWMIWLTSVTFPIALIRTSHQRLVFGGRFMTPSEVPEPDIVVLGLMIVIGGFIGSGIGLLTISGAVAGAMRYRGLLWPIFQSILNLAIVFMLLAFVTMVEVDLTIVIKPLLVGAILAGIPLGLSIILAKLWTIPLYDLRSIPHLACATLCSIAFYALVFLLGLLLSFGDSGDLLAAFAIVGGGLILILLAMLSLLIVNWQSVQGVQLFFIIMWVLVMASFLLRFGAFYGEHTDKTFLWLVIFGLSQAVWSFGFYNAERAEQHLWTQVI